MLFNEPKLLKSKCGCSIAAISRARFSALQRAEIAEISSAPRQERGNSSFSALQRAEIAEIRYPDGSTQTLHGFSALQRAEIAEIL